ncbi:MAG: hypothetical protein Q4D07_06255 [Selenomonadaceae bacterium]|nr:hypothetical protein [Selenomonadaceae bacterium]
MRKYIATAVVMMFIFAFTIAGTHAEPLASDTMIYPSVTNSKPDNHGKHTAPPPGKPDKRKWQGTKTKR